MPFVLIVDILVKAIQSVPKIIETKEKIIEAISSSKDLTSEEKEALKRRITDAQAGVPEWI